jgi:hypothetical protein
MNGDGRADYFVRHLVDAGRCCSTLRHARPSARPLRTLRLCGESVFLLE